MTKPKFSDPRWRFAILAIAIMVLGFLVWNWSSWKAQAQVGAAYGARITCSCRYVEGRDIKNCAGDTEPGMEIVTIKDMPDQKAVTGSVPLMAKRTARYRTGFGCVLD